MANLLREHEGGEEENVTSIGASNRIRCLGEEGGMLRGSGSSVALGMHHRGDAQPRAIGSRAGRSAAIPVLGSGIGLGDLLGTASVEAKSRETGDDFAHLSANTWKRMSSVDCSPGFSAYHRLHKCNHNMLETRVPASLSNPVRGV